MCNLYTSISVNLKYKKKQAKLVICAPNTISQRQLTVYKLIVFCLSLTKMKLKLVETETTLGVFPCETIRAPIGSEH